MSELPIYRIMASSFEEDLFPGDGPRAFVQRLPFDVWLESRVIAHVHALRVQVELGEASGLSVFELFDSVDQDLHELYGAIYDQDSDEPREDLVDPTGLRDVLYIDALKIVSNERGKRLGLRIVERIRNMSGGGCAAIALNARPLSVDDEKWPDKVDYEVFDRSFLTSGAEAAERLRAYWGQLGFKRVNNTNFMVFDLSEVPPDLSSRTSLG
jgi:hypothetical protein